MASNTPKKPSQESVQHLLKFYEYIDGTVNFSRYAKDHNISRSAAMKRLKRAIDDNNINTTTWGNTIGTGSATTTNTTTDTTNTASVTTPRKRKAKETDTLNDTTPKEIPTK